MADTSGSSASNVTVTFRYGESGGIFHTGCYLTGTRIAVPGGEAAIETLKIGDLVLTASGDQKAIKWIGRSTFEAGVLAGNPQLRPVLIRRDAIAPGMPHRDLKVSADHAVVIDGAFVRAATLVNGVSVVRTDETTDLTYIHIETDAQDVVFAEGLPAETFVDDNSRLMFDNAHEYAELYGADDVAATFSGTRFEEGAQLEAVRRRIAARAGVTAAPATSGALRGNVERIEEGVLHGWAAGRDGQSAVEIEVLVDGEVIARTIANRYRVDLDHAGIADGCAGYTVALPASAESLSQITVRRAADGLRIGEKAALAAE